jgi:hypothetical protein
LPGLLTQATALTRQIIAIGGQVAQLREEYVLLVEKILPGKKSAFFLFDRRLVMLIDVQLATQIPMVQP